MVVQLPPCPASLKAVQHYLKTATEHDGRDVVISYWCRVYSLQAALKIDKKSDEAKVLLMALMDWLEKEKRSLSDNEAITNDVAAQAHIENYALKLFLWADGQDRAGQFNKNVVKAFYTAGFLMDVLNTFGEQTEEVQQNCKYAKWKAAYIHNCLRNGEMPVPGPMGGEEGEDLAMGPGPGPSQPSLGFEGIHQPNQLPSVPSDPTVSGSNSTMHFPTPTSGSSMFNLPSPPSGPSSYTSLPTLPTSQPSPAPRATPAPAPAYNPATDYTPKAGGSGVELNPEQINKAQKYCKWAGSALNYDDVPEAISNIQKALKLLTTGDDS